MGILTRAIAKISSANTQGVQRVKDTFKLISSNISQGKLLTGVPVAKKYENTTIGKVATTITKPAVVAAAAVAPALVAKSSIILPAASKAAVAITSAAIKNPMTTIKTGAVVAFAAPLLATSSKARQAVVNAPGSLARAGADAGRLIDNPTTTNLKTFIEENKPALVVAGAAVSISALTTASGYLATSSNTAAIKANTAATQTTITTAFKKAVEQVNKSVPVSKQDSPVLNQISQPAIAANPATTSLISPKESQVLPASPKKKPAKKKKKKAGAKKKKKKAGAKKKKKTTKKKKKKSSAKRSALLKKKKSSKKKTTKRRKKK